MAKIIDRDVQKSVRAFINTCLDKDVSVDKAFELVNELTISIAEKRLDAKVWMETVDKAVAEANKEGVTL